MHAAERDRVILNLLEEQRFVSFRELSLRVSASAATLRRDLERLQEAGMLKRIGGSRRTAYGYLEWFKKRGLASRFHPLPGDLVIWGGGGHVGIYVGHGKAVSALTSGVQVHKVKNTNPPFTTYLHVKWPAPVGFKL